MIGAMKPQSLVLSLVLGLLSLPLTGCVPTLTAGEVRDIETSSYDATLWYTGTDGKSHWAVFEPSPKEYYTFRVDTASLNVREPMRPSNDPDQWERMVYVGEGYALENDPDARPVRARGTGTRQPVRRDFNDLVLPEIAPRRATPSATTPTTTQPTATRPMRSTTASGAAGTSAGADSGATSGAAFGAGATSRRSSSQPAGPAPYEPVIAPSRRSVYTPGAGRSIQDYGNEMNRGLFRAPSGDWADDETTR